MKLRKICLFTIILIFSTLIISAGPGSDYVHRLGSEGWVYYVFSSKMPATNDTKNPKNIEYDYTYVQKPDSVFLLCTIQTNGYQRPNMTNILCCDTIYNIKPELIYANPYKDGFKCRLKISFQYETWERMYHCDKPFILRFIFGNSENQLKYDFGFSKKKWEKERKKILAVQEAIKFGVE